MTYAIAADGITRTFGPVVALDRVTLSVATGEVVGLLGHNGAGKTTTIRILNGLLAPDAGRVHVGGLDPTVDGARVRARTGVLTETPSLDERLSARENLLFFGRLYGLGRRHLAARVDQMLEQFGLAERARDRVTGLSRGMKQRLALARALIHDPELLFLDEPTAALDPLAARAVHDLIRGLTAQARRTVVLTTHNLVEAQRLCDRVFILRQGRLLAHGTPAELAHRLAVRSTLELEVGRREAGRAVALLAANGLSAAATGGETLTVEGIARHDVPRVSSLLVAAGISIYRLSAGEPTLEEAYFALHGVGPAEMVEPASGTAAEPVSER